MTGAYHTRLFSRPALVQKSIPRTSPPYRTLTTHPSSLAATMAPLLTPPAPNKTTNKPPLKILMLHGFTQSGTLFRAKTGALTKAITKAFPLHTVSFSYPTGPLRLNPFDVPGYNNGGTTEDKGETETFGWFRRPATEPPTYKGIEDGLASVAALLKTEGPFDGVVGFSQGACLAFIVASLLEPNRRVSFDAAVTSSDGVEFPESFLPKNTGNHPPLKFAIVYSGFKAADPKWGAMGKQVAAVLTYIRNSWGNVAPEVEAGDVTAMRKALDKSPD